MKKFFKKRKKLLIICGFCCLLLIAGVLNLVLNNNTVAKQNNGGTVTTANFFTTYKTDRQTTVDQEKLYLEAIMANANSSEEAKANAEKELLKLTTYMGLQNKLEGLITAKGFSQVAVSASENNVSVIVQTSGLSDADVANIVEAITTNSDYNLENIKIIPVE